MNTGIIYFNDKPMGGRKDSGITYNAKHGR